MLADAEKEKYLVPMPHKSCKTSNHFSFPLPLWWWLVSMAKGKNSISSSSMLSVLSGRLPARRPIPFQLPLALPLSPALFSTLPAPPKLDVEP